ncbi:DNA-binding transcriptional regulator, LysR family [Rhodoblastus acidophilus]|uniref:DNA-binding transcriptional regulator, LysR family n=1 Tax=Rhodoblastus acidophilus TaxID=1074 RepID=A0A212PZ23_RHOAC|nr:LysR family transcriptional regulator [Rhodoblastus acidophilus]PPQ38683.1 hypothetical protein CKO16_08685 [Rhodoblastus acidophilus]RAI17820.1 hypothetical protein CH337_15560 [Rhodoblastus acidophilus]SNB52355.1 DNA-binding transcriptional regulator, LysR family [Rhodoblastus acidophilus]
MDRLDHLALFVAVAERGGFGAAARKAGRSAAAVTRAVAALEEEFGARLFNRTTRAVHLTDEGDKLFARAKNLLADYDDMAESLRGAVEPRGLLTITAPVMFGRLHIMPLVKDFLRAHRQAQIDLRLHDNVLSLIDEGVDLGVRIGELPDSSLIALRVGAVRRQLVAAPAYLAARGAPKTPADLANHDLISTFNLSAQPGLWPLGPREEHLLRIRPHLTVNSVDAALDAAISGLGIARLFSYQVEAAVARGALRPILRDQEPPPAPIHLLRPAGRRSPAKVSAFIDAAATVLRAKFA